MAAGGVISSPAGGYRRILRRSARVAGLTLSAILALTCVDAVAGLAYRTGTAASLTVTNAGAPRPRLLVVFPGFIMRGDLLGRAFAPYLPADETMIAVRYADRGVDMDAIYAQVMREVRILSPSIVTVYGASMGGMCARDFLTRYARDGDPYGKVTLILDTVPSSAAQVRRPGWMFELASWYRGGPVTSAVWAAASHTVAEPMPAPDADLELVDEAHHAGSWAGMPAITSQAAYMGTFAALRDSELVASAQRVVFLRGSGSGEDPLIRTDGSIAGWRRAFPDLTLATVEGRPIRFHVPLVEYPGETMTAIISAQGPAS